MTRLDIKVLQFLMRFFLRCSPWSGALGLLAEAGAMCKIEKRWFQIRVWCCIVLREKAVLPHLVFFLVNSETTATSWM